MTRVTFGMSLVYVFFLCCVCRGCLYKCPQGGVSVCRGGGSHGLVLRVRCACVTIPCYVSIPYTFCLCLPLSVFMYLSAFLGAVPGTQLSEGKAHVIITSTMFVYLEECVCITVFRSL